MDKQVKLMIKESKRKYVDEAIASAKNGNNGAYYRVAKGLATAERSKPWAVGQIFPDQTPERTAEAVMDFFGAISHILPPLKEHLKPQNLGGTEMGKLEQ